MATEPDNWIQDSLTRLEALELEREQHEQALESVTEPQDLRTHSEAIERLDEEIRRLYEVLEAVAAQQEQPGEPVSEVTATSEFHQAPEDQEAAANPHAPFAAATDPVPSAQPAFPSQQPMAPPAVQPPVVQQPVAPAQVQPPVVQQPVAPTQVQPPFVQQPVQPPFAQQPVQPPFGQQPAASVAPDDFDPFGPHPSSSASGAALSGPGASGAAMASAAGLSGSAGLGPLGVTGEQPVSSAFDAPSYDMADDVDLPSSGGGALKWVVIAVLVLGGGGVGAYMFTQRSQEAAEAPPAAPAGPPQVISATPVPPDTQGPNVAKGGEASVTPGTEIRPSAHRGGGGGGSQRARPAESDSQQQGHEVKVEKVDDPLGGLK